ncbi:MAG: DNA (cytosine-5-)-methyltransferase [Methanobacteriota archaeon]|nr:MAG: DNA (cytosine-5-)-methyltransferase [Euryarchaeota archaeon]
MRKKEYFSVAEVADLLGVSKNTVRNWEKNGKLESVRNPQNNYRMFHISSLTKFPELSYLFEDFEEEEIVPLREYSGIELFAGAGGLALGFENVGLKSKLLVEIDKDACATLRINRPNYNIIEDDIKNVSFKGMDADFVSGGFPCQSFSYAGKKEGFGDIRGTLFFDFARAIHEVQPPIFIGENVRGLLSHDKGRTIKTMIHTLTDLGYNVQVKLLKAIHYGVPQKRERTFIIGTLDDYNFRFPKRVPGIVTLREALKGVPPSEGKTYPEWKRKIMELVPPGGYWKDLPEDLQKIYMKGSYKLQGGKTGIARRMSWDEPCLTLTTSPDQMQTERCHPEETRPFTVREYARIQTFPDNWQFCGSLASKYRQIGNAVPVKLAEHVGKEVVRTLNQTSPRHEDCNADICTICKKPTSFFQNSKKQLTLAEYL